MNCAGCKELLVERLEGLLNDSQEQAVREHLKTCETCRAELQGLQTLRQRLVGNGKALAQASVEDDVMNRIIQEQNARFRSAAQAGTGLRIRRLIMNNPKTRIAAAAAVVVACAVGAMLWTGTQSIALAEVLAKVEQIQAYMYKTKTTMEDPMIGTTATESTVLVSNEYGMRIDQTGTHVKDGQETHTRLVTYMLPQEKAVVLVNLGEKRYARMALDDAVLENARTQNRDPRETLKSLLGCRYKELGTSVIDGRKVQGFETTDPGYLGGTRERVHVTLWVDAESGLPVRSETKMETREGLRIDAVDYDYQWDLPVSTAEFRPEIPADFAADPMDGTQMPSFSEKGFIEALQMVVEFTGRYPEAIDTEGLRKVSMDVAGAMMTSDKPAAQQWREQIKNAGSKEAAAMAIQPLMMKLMPLAMFHKMLGAQQKDPVYRGDVVTPSDIKLPLMRWKLSDSEYRVVFGDLHAETVSSEALATLEAALPK